MGCLVTRGGLHRHSYSAGPGPAWTTQHAVSASVPGPHAGQTTMPIAAGVATFAPDGAPYYNSGDLPGYPSTHLPGRHVRVALPPLAAQLAPADRQSWGRPLFSRGAC